MAGQPWALGKRAFGFCDLCGFRYDLKRLKALTVKLKLTNLLACPQCWTPDQPQLQVGMRKIIDPEALRNPRPDNSYRSSGRNVLRYPSEGSRILFWGWNPVGFDNSTSPGLDNSLIGVASVGEVEVSFAMVAGVDVTGVSAVGGVGSVDVIIGEFDFSGSLSASASVGFVTTTP
jgi:hypothetical protein